MLAVKLFYGQLIIIINLELYQNLFKIFRNDVVDALRFSIAYGDLVLYLFALNFN